MKGSGIVINSIRILPILISFTLVLFSSGCDAPVDYSGMFRTELSNIKLRDYDGNVVSYKDISEGYVLFYVPLANESSNEVALGSISDFEKNEPLSISKVYLSDYSETAPSGWNTIVDPGLKAAFLSKYPGCFTMLFHNSDFLGGLYTSEQSGFKVNRIYVIKGLYKYLLGYNTFEEIVESNRPESFTDTSAVFSLFEKYLNNYRHQYVLYINVANLKCNNLNIVEFFNRSFSNSSISYGCVLFSSAYNSNDIDAFINNFNISIPVLPCPDNIIDDFNRLSDVNFTNKYNVLYYYVNNTFERSVYVYSDCDVMFQNLMVN